MDINSQNRFVLIVEFFDFPNVELDGFVVMPNYVHGIIILNEHNVGVQNLEPPRMNSVRV